MQLLNTGQCLPVQLLDSAATGEDDEDSALADDDESPLNALVVEPSDLPPAATAA